jgi:6-phosphofructokinase 1
LYCIIYRNGKANIKLETKTIAEIYTEEGNGVFITSFVDLANLQQSISPSPLDRILAIKFGYRCGDWLLNNLQSNNAVVIGIIEKRYTFSNITDLIPQTDFEYYFKIEFFSNKL